MMLKHGADAEAKDNVSTVPPSSPPLAPYDGTPVPRVDDDDDDDAVPVRHADASSHSLAIHHCTRPAITVRSRWWRCC